jgi:hypothetical protein
MIHPDCICHACKTEAAIPAYLEVGWYYKAKGPGVFSTQAVWCCDFIVPPHLAGPYGNTVASGHYMNPDGTLGRTRSLQKNEVGKIEVTEFKPLRSGKGWASIRKITGELSLWRGKPCKLDNYDDFEIEWKEVR